MIDTALEALPIAIATIAGVEAIIRLPLLRLAAELAMLSRRGARVIAATGISDHWKARATSLYAARILVRSVVLLLLLLAVLALFLGVCQMAGTLLFREYRALDELAGLPALALTLVLGVAYGLLRIHRRRA